MNMPIERSHELAMALFALSVTVYVIIMYEHVNIFDSNH